eukprot:1500609-Pyramimonas_sp.AAC.1
MTTRASVFESGQVTGSDHNRLTNVVDGGHIIFNEALKTVQEGWAHRRKAVTNVDSTKVLSGSV